VDVTVRGEGADPKTVVETAIEMKKLAEREARRARDEFLKYDQVGVFLIVMSILDSRMPCNRRELTRYS
jgi:hypothetical protein